MRYVIREKLFRLGEDSAITDESGRAVYEVDGKVFSLRNTLVMRDTAGNEVATVRKKLISLRPTYEITRHGQELGTVRKKLISFLGDRFDVDIPGPHDLEVKGNLFEHEFTVSRDGQTVATISKRWFSLRNTYGVDIAPRQDDVLILASVLAFDLVEDAERERD